ncbi:recombinase family protein [Candidatus Gracilibacteria bacterium]|nr:recombinase family protein [Candidatus Gracilibacteria bacterium]
MKKVGIYTRVSTRDKQDLEVQLLPLRQYAQARGFFIYKEYSDKISGAKESRPGLDSLMDDAKKRKIDSVLIFRFDRFSRSTKQLINSLDLFNSLGIDFISYSENIDTSSPAGKVLFTMISAFAEFERNIIGERVRAGIEKAKANGVTLGRKKLDVNIKRIVKLKEEGMTYRDIADKMRLKKSYVYNKYKEYKLNLV